MAKKVTFKKVSYKALVRAADPHQHSKRDAEYEFSNGRKFLRRRVPTYATITP